MHINAYVCTEFDGMSSQDVLNRYTQIPEYITASDIFKKKIDHLFKILQCQYRDGNISGG